MPNSNWSDHEKKVARRAFDAALQRELAAVMATVKAMAAKVERPEQIWAMEDYLREQREAIDGKYTYRYSQLVLVLGILLREQWIRDEELEGLAEDKRETIRLIASP